MNIETSHEYPTRPAEFLNRSAEVVSRLGGVMAFGFCLIGLLYMVAR